MSGLDTSGSRLSYYVRSIINRMLTPTLKVSLPPSEESKNLGVLFMSDGATLWRFSGMSSKGGDTVRIKHVLKKLFGNVLGSLQKQLKSVAVEREV